MSRFFWQESVCQSREAATGPENGALWRGKDFNFWTAVIRRLIVWVSKSTVAGWHYCLQQMLLSNWAGSYPYRVVRDPASARSYCPLADLLVRQSSSHKYSHSKGNWGKYKTPIFYQNPISNKHILSVLSRICMYCLHFYFVICKLSWISSLWYQGYDGWHKKLFLIFDIK